eukprot:4761393-Ditylum_brightwellii.AAC.1
MMMTLQWELTQQPTQKMRQTTTIPPDTGRCAQSVLTLQGRYQPTVVGVETPMEGIGGFGC